MEADGFEMRNAKMSWGTQAADVADMSQSIKYSGVHLGRLTENNIYEACLQIYGNGISQYAKSIRLNIKKYCRALSHWPSNHRAHHSNCVK